MQDPEPLTVAESEPQRPGDALVIPGEALVRPGQDDAPPHACVYRVADETVDSFVAQPDAFVLSPIDGLPTPADGHVHLAIATVFSEDTFVCMEDKRWYVSYYTDEVDSLPDEALAALSNLGEITSKPRWGNDGSAVARDRFDASSVFALFGIDFVYFDEANRICRWLDRSPSERGRPNFFPVRPVRPRCAHYGAAVFGNDDQTDPSQPGHKILQRFCQDRRSIGGALMGLNDEAVYACTLRSPPDHGSAEHHIDAPDRERIAAKVELVPLFNNKDKS